MDPNALGTYWLYKLPDVSFRETLQSCLEHKMFGALPAHGTFLYPKEYGYGEVWRRMGEALSDKLHLGETLTGVDVERRIVNGKYQADMIVNSVPWTFWAQNTALPEEVRAAIERLVQVPIDVDYVAETLPSDSHWTTIPTRPRAIIASSCGRTSARARRVTGRRPTRPVRWATAAATAAVARASGTATSTPTRSTRWTSRRR